MKQYVLISRNIYTKDEAYGPYPNYDSVRTHLYQIFGDDWRYSNFEILKMQDPVQLEIHNLTQQDK